ncbi:MAG: HD domain-containing protein [Clostridia bacterium]|nr:HD domain-containing protein [Clostridia bacterium]
MRIGNQGSNNERYKIMTLDDERGIVDALKVILAKPQYDIVGETDPLKALEILKKDHFDLLVVDFMMMPLHGDQVVEEVRKFDRTIHIILLTGHKDLAPPLEMIQRLEIQGYCEKSEKFEQLVLMVESGIKAVDQMREISKMNKKLESSYVETIELIRQAVEAKDPYTRGHSDRVSEYSVLIAKKLGLSEQDIDTIRIGGLFHDIGKIGVPDVILRKTERLTNEEYDEIKKHPSTGASILAQASIFQDIVPIVKHHHERFDGNGYPEKLGGENIPYFARIAAVADTFDAMTSRRTYRDALSLDIVKEEIKKCKGSQFDPQIADVFLDILENDYEKIQEIKEKYVG